MLVSSLPSPSLHAVMTYSPDKRTFPCYFSRYGKIEKLSQLQLLDFFLKPITGLKILRRLETTALKIALFHLKLGTKLVFSSVLKMLRHILSSVQTTWTKFLVQEFDPTTFIGISELFSFFSNVFFIPFSKKITVSTEFLLLHLKTRWWKLLSLHENGAAAVGGCWEGQGEGRGRERERKFYFLTAKTKMSMEAQTHQVY